MGGGHAHAATGWIPKLGESDADRLTTGVMLRAVRERAGVSRERVAAECGKTVAAVGHWETGKAKPSRADLKVYAELCGIPLGDLLRLIGLGDEPLSLPQYWRERLRQPACLVLARA